MASAAVLTAVVQPSSASGATLLPTASALKAYVAAVEPIRDGVNSLLDTADPMLELWRTHRITGAQAGSAMSSIEQRFAVSTVQINALQTGDPPLDRINAPYAHTYVLEDAYLRALAEALPTGNFSPLPKTAEQQRRTIVVWRKQVEALGRRLGVPLPKDLARAGRGDIAPSPFGS